MASTANLIREIRATNQSVLIGYFPAGYPTLADSVEACLAMLDSGVDVLELGVPYSDPVMDGLVIQQATETALANGFKLSQVFEVIKRIKELSDKPVLVMSYWNPIIQYGVERFAKDLKESGAAGLITPDLIPDEAGQWLAVSDQLNLDRVFMATPSSSQQRLAKAAELSRGFVYAVSTMGITGAREDLDAKARAVVSGIKAAGSQTPVCVGIGISSGVQVAEVNSYSDGAIVGSAIINAFNTGGIDNLRKTVKSLKAGAQK
ncbi:MAG: tryptophan synthase subunit alpha [Actinobacteria bacterium]|nr:tryptophan synthase subunit alpha [Actinomycetota bacterium]NBT46328.1 tryptophan synthase subunit alpha [Actinomycetota bacterium]NBY44285.1 tryptophan synthase subunit alpha [Micrococcales bacterium]